MKTPPLSIKPIRFSSLLRLAAVGLPVWLAALSSLAEVRLPAIYSDHMVLQQGGAAPIWGWADPDEEITVSIAGQTKSAKTGADGKWTLKLDALRPGETLTLTVQGKNTLVIQDVLVGEIWLCSGQSNMGMTVAGANHFDEEKAASGFPKLRMFKEGDGPATSPQEQGKGTWLVSGPETVGGFSATAYFFGCEVHQKLGVPVGLINSSVGGTAIEAWTSWDAQKDKAEFKPIFERWETRKATWDPAKAEAQYEKQRTAWKVVSTKAKAEGKSAPRAPRKPVEPRLEANHPANLFN